MAKIIETQLHPDGDKDTVLYPETSVEQIVGFNDKVADIIDNSVESVVESKIPSYYVHSIVLKTPGSYINIRIITKNNDIFTYRELVNFLKDFDNMHKNTYECTGFSSANNTVITGIGVDVTFTKLMYHYGLDGVTSINDFDSTITDTIMSI